MRRLLPAVSGRRRAALASAGLVVVLPLSAFLIAPAGADDSPGANLAGINATSNATGVQISPLTPGVVGAGNVSQGNLVEAALPYAASSTSTGPSSSAVASPAYPGDTAAGAGNALGTFAPQFPPALLNLLNYPVVARADYPAQLTTGSSSTYSPPGGPAAGAGTAAASATDSGSAAQATTSDSGISAAIEIGSSRTSSNTVLGASSVKATAHSDVSTVTLLGGVVRIAGISSDASASSDGSTGTETSGLTIASVTVAGQAASIGPKGITVNSAGQGSLLVPDANSALAALQQAGISVRTVAPVSSTDGASATVTSGAVQITFLDDNLPNPNGAIPVSSVGLDVYLGLSSATADATALPPFTNVVSPAVPSGSGSTPASVSTGGSASVLAAPAVAATSGPVLATPTAGVGQTSAAAPSLGSTTPTTAAAAAAGGAPSPATVPAATLFGAPLKVAWVVIAFLLSLVAAGPLLGYANWQLLRGRKT
jgi:hypothetical protein